MLPYRQAHTVLPAVTSEPQNKDYKSTYSIAWCRIRHLKLEKKKQVRRQSRIFDMRAGGHNNAYNSQRTHANCACSGCGNANPYLIEMRMMFH